MERSDTQPAFEEMRVPDAPFGESLSVQDRMMNLVLSLRAELYNLHAHHQALLEEVTKLRRLSIRTPKIAVEDNAVSPGASGEDKPVLCSDERDRTETLQAPAHETDGGTADEGDVSGSVSLRRALNSPTPV